MICIKLQCRLKRIWTKYQNYHRSVGQADISLAGHLVWFWLVITLKIFSFITLPPPKQQFFPQLQEVSYHPHQSATKNVCKKVCQWSIVNWHCDVFDVMMLIFSIWELLQFWQPQHGQCKYWGTNNLSNFAVLVL